MNAIKISKFLRLDLLPNTPYSKNFHDRLVLPLAASIALQGHMLGCVPQFILFILSAMEASFFRNNYKIQLSGVGNTHNFDWHHLLYRI